MGKIARFVTLSEWIGRKMPTPPENELREYHRIRFPLAERPTLVWADKTYAVIDVSLRGLRYVAPGVKPPQIHDPVTGTLRFRRGAQVKIEGMVVRVLDEQIALRLDKDIPFGILMAEERYLRTHYPMWS